MVINTPSENDTNYALDVAVAYNALNGFGIVSGCAISKGTGDWDIDATSGTVFITGTGEVSVSSGTVTLTQPSNDADMDAGESRIDLVTADTGGTLAAVEGTAASNPDYPTIPSNEVVLGFVEVFESDSTVADSTIVDVPVFYGDNSALLKDSGSHEIEVDDFPGSNGSDGQVLTTDGTAASWGTSPFHATFHASGETTDTGSWTTRAVFTSLNSVTWSRFSSGVFEASIRASGGGTAEARARDTTNSSTLASVSTTNTAATRLTDSTVSFPSGTADVQYEVQNTSNSVVSSSAGLGAE